MADLGAIGRNSTQPPRQWTDGKPRFFQGIHQGVPPSPPMERDDSDGTPAPPCEKQIGPGIDRRILWPVDPGSPPAERTFSIYVRHPGIAPYPRIIVKANPEVGLNADIIVTAAATTAWQELTASFTPRRKGVVEVWREVPAPVQNAYAKWDRITVT
jgi:hypothetical protein